jgi:hypothetical protein
MVCAYTTRFPHVNSDSVPPSRTEVIPWHSPADEVIADVWCDQNAWRDRDSHALSVVIVDGTRGFDTPSDVRVLLFRDGGDWSFPSGKTDADEGAVEVAARCFPAATGGSLGSIAVEHMRESFWCLQRWGGVHQYDNHSYFVWFPSLDAFNDMGTDDFSAEVRWHRKCDDPFDSSSPDRECMSLTRDARMNFTTRHFFFSLRGATLIAKMIASEAGGAYEFTPSPDSLTTVPGTDQEGALGVCRYCACKIVCLVCGCNTCAANGDAPTSGTFGTLCARARSRGLRCGDPSTLFKVTGLTPTTGTNSGISDGSVDECPSEWTLTGLACDDPIFSYGVVGSCTRSGLTRWLGSRAHLADRTWPLIIGDLKADDAAPTGNDKLAEWSVYVEYAGEALGARLTVPLPRDLATLVRHFDDETLVHD